MNKINIARSEEIINKVFDLMRIQGTGCFNKRDTGLSLQTFLITFTVMVCSMKRVTLEGLAIKCQEIQYGLSLTKQALHKRLEQGSKALQSLLGSVVMATVAVNTQRLQTAMVLEQFEAVLITDATTISLPDKLAAFHKGLGGTNAQSAMKIQATYDVKSKKFRKIAFIANATENDSSYMAELIEEIRRNELTITDLGYYGVSSFLKIDAKGAYFISKIKSNTIFYTTSSERLDLTQLLKSRNTIDKTVVIKGDERKLSMNVRLCGIKLPEKVYAERLRKANKAAVSSGKTLSQDDKERLKWILMVTNIPRDMLDIQSICEIYRIRWQIELIFKSWKSYFAIDEMNNIGKDYWDCLIYGKLIVITLLTSLYAQIYHQVYLTAQRQVSLLRFMKNMHEDLDILIDYWVLHKSEHQVVLAINRVILGSLIEKRRRKTTEQVISDLDLPYEVLKMLSDFSA